MAYNVFGLRLGRGDVSDNASTVSLATHTYRSDVDAMATITAEGYFPAYLGADENIVQVGDVLQILDSEKVLLSYQITNGSPIELSALSSGGGGEGETEATSFVINMGGALEGPYTIYVEKAGKTVNLNFPDFFGEAIDEGTGYFYSTETMPERFRPSSTIYSEENGIVFQATGVSDGVFVEVWVNVQPFGGFAFTTKGFNDFSHTGEIGVYGCSVAYQTN